MKTVAQAGFEVIEPVYGLLAGGEMLVTPEEKDLGCLFIDFGGQSISIGVYAEGSCRYSKELAIGSDFITRDLAVALCIEQHAQPRHLEDAVTPQRAEPQQLAKITSRENDRRHAVVEREHCENIAERHLGTTKIGAETARVDDREVSLRYVLPDHIRDQVTER
jgi:cell division ATPase FtsA